MTLFVPLFLLLLLSAPAGAAPPVVSTATAASASAVEDPFVREAARRLGVTAEDVAALRLKGFGKTELLSFVSIAKASPKPWKDLVKERERGKPLREMAVEAGLKYDKIFEASAALRTEIEKTLRADPIAP